MVSLSKKQSISEGNCDTFMHRFLIPYECIYILYELKMTILIALLQIN